MIKKADIESDRAVSSEDYKVASILLLLYFHLTVLAVTLLTRKSQPAVTRREQ